MAFKWVVTYTACPLRKLTWIVKTNVLTLQRYDKFPKLPNFWAKICILFVIPYADVVAGRGEGGPGEMEPAVAGEELVGILTFLEEFHQSPEL